MDLNTPKPDSVFSGKMGLNVPKTETPFWKKVEAIKSLLDDPLGKIARIERRNLLAVSTLGIFVAKTGLIPMKIQALGVEFSGSTATWIPKIIIGIIVYYMVAFIVYGGADMATWRFRCKVSILELNLAINSKNVNILNLPNDAAIDALMAAKEQAKRMAVDPKWRLLSIIRSLIEYLFPVGLAIYAIIVLVKFHLPPPANTSPGIPFLISH